MVSHVLTNLGSENIDKDKNDSDDSHFIFIMIVFFLAKKESILIPNAENKDRTGAF